MAHNVTVLCEVQTFFLWYNLTESTTEKMSEFGRDALSLFKGRRAT